MALPFFAARGSAVQKKNPVRILSKARARRRTSASALALLARPNWTRGGLVFIDETWIKTNMAPLRGWGPKGKRLRSFRSPRPLGER